MTALLTRLRIAGFKSFAEPVSLDILPGLTGIVGPNGCGKSNVVEALRWAMGETSARSLRGGEMDDVIFAGTAARPGRNLAEVTITLESPLPAPFEAEAELQVTRRIERGAGSAYRANGRELRARDVQTLFADLASGARSSGMVSQGRVAALIGARPEERRMVLEEAAGITGLHARRHEAELKLRAAEANLSRAEDLRLQLETTREGLRRQARQTARYRNLSGLIRSAETEQLAVLHGRAAAGLAAAQKAVAAAAAAAAQAARDAESAALQEAEAEAALPEPRRIEAQFRSALERRRLEAETLAAEADRAARALADAQARAGEMAADLADAENALADAAEKLAHLAQEAAGLDLASREMPAALALAENAMREADDAIAVAEQEAEGATEAAAEAAAASRQSTAALAAAGSRLEAARAEHEQARQEHELLGQGQVSEAALADALQRVGIAESDLGSSRRRLTQCEADREQAAAKLAAMRHEIEREAARAQSTNARHAASAARLDRLSSDLIALESALAAARSARVSSDQLSAAEAARTAAGAELAACQTRSDHAEQTAAATENEYRRTIQAVEALAKERARATEAVAAARLRLNDIITEATTLAAALEAAVQATIDPSRLAAATAAEADAADTLVETQAALRRLSNGREQAERALADRRILAAERAASLARAQAEGDGLRAVLQAGSSESPTQAPPALDAMHVPPGLEAALGAALGEAADASLDPVSTRYWNHIPAHDAAIAPTPPTGTTPLAELVRPPPALARALSFVALLPDDIAGGELQPHLAPGQVVVSREGGAWRWDGLVTRPGTSGAAIRLAQRHQLREAEAACHALQLEWAQAAEALAPAETAAIAAAEWEASARESRDRAEALLVRARAELVRLQAEAARAADRKETLLSSQARLTREHDIAEAGLGQAEATLRELTDPAQLAREQNEAERRRQSAAEEQKSARHALLQARQDFAIFSAAAQSLAAEAAAAESREAALFAPRTALVAELSAAQAAHAELDRERQTLADLPQLRSAAEAALLAVSGAQQAETAARAATLQAEQAVDRARAEAASLTAERVQCESRLQATARLLGRSEVNLAEAGVAHLLAGQTHAALPDPEALAERARAARVRVIQSRATKTAAETAYRGLDARLQAARHRTQALSAEQLEWQARQHEWDRRRAALAARQQALTQELATLEGTPARLRDQAAMSGERLAQAEAAHQAAAEALDQAERHQRECAEARHATAAALSACREEAARAQGAHATSLAALHSVLARAAERLGPDAELPESDDVSEAAEDRARRKLERLLRERDEMGPVNLRAEIEVQEIDTQIETIERDRGELATAIAKLRGSIGHLNREGRERLTAIFTEIDRHFRTLFTRMMGGGRAHLALVGSDDPLEAGLEIYAEPPGKKLAALSLLSGGEQALTALSLIFAVFRCTPAPISVLDEVDAPLDDANVERFCALLDDLVRDTGTRFLVVTHHQLTMSRMDRLFGVTMQERGVSRLLSVNLAKAAEMAQPAMRAAE